MARQIVWVANGEVCIDQNAQPLDIFTECQLLLQRVHEICMEEQGRPGRPQGINVTLRGVRVSITRQSDPQLLYRQWREAAGKGGRRQVGP